MFLQEEKKIQLLSKRNIQLQLVTGNLFVHITVEYFSQMLPECLGTSEDI